MSPGSQLIRFPLPLSLGTDICRISRIHAILAKPSGSRFIRRLLAQSELKDPRSTLPLFEHAKGSPIRSRDTCFENQAKSPLWATAVFIAGRFAAKEAVIKAHPHRRLTFHDIIISPPSAMPGAFASSGPPSVVIMGAHDGVADQEARISISHDSEYATAVCMGFNPDDVGSKEREGAE